MTEYVCATEYPYDTDLTSKQIALALDEGIEESNIVRLFNDYTYYYTNEPYKFVDWDAAWVRWLKRKLILHPELKYENVDDIEDCE
jgi:hypothetical protein